MKFEMIVYFFVMSMVVLNRNGLLVLEFFFPKYYLYFEISVVLIEDRLKMNLDMMEVE